MNILFIDVETTGLQSDRHTVVEIACGLYVNGRQVDKFHTKLFSPVGNTISLGALKVNGLKMSELIQQGLDNKEDKAVIAFLDFLLGLKINGPLYVGGQNVKFDLDFIKALLRKYNVEDLDQLIGYKSLDTFSLAMALHAKGRLIIPDGKLNLQNIAKALNINMSNRKLHTATDDMELAAEVWYKLLDLIG